MTVPICDLIKDPIRYHGRLVEVHSRIAPAIIDTPDALVDLTCAASVPLYVDAPEAEKTVGAYREFRRYLSEWRTVEATVFGRFEMILVPSKKPILSFRLIRVTNVTPGPAYFPKRRKPT